MPTLNEIYNKSLALIDEVLPSGAIDPAKTEDYRGKAPYIADILQKELLKVSDFYKIYEISRSPIISMFGIGEGFDLREYKGNEDLIFEAVNNEYGGVKAYYFEVDGPATIYIEDFNGVWNTLATITANPTTSGFTAYKGIVTPSANATLSRIRFSGNYYYRTINRALFNIPLQNAIDFKMWLKIDLPTTLKAIDKVITEDETYRYNRDTGYKIEWEGNRQSLYVNYYFEGKIRVQYKPIPTTVTSLNDNLEIDDITSQTIAYGLAMHFMASEQNEYLTNLFQARFEALKLDNRTIRPTEMNQCIDMYSNTNEF